MMHEYGFLHFPPDAVRVEPAQVEELPQSARTVFDAIRQRGPMSHAELREATGMAPRTIRFAVNRLRELELVDAVNSLQDCRTCYFYIHKSRVDPAFIQEMRNRAQEAAREEGKVIEKLEPRPRPRPVGFRKW